MVISKGWDYTLLHAYKSTSVRTREIRIDPMSPTVFEKKKNIAAKHYKNMPPISSASWTWTCVS
jgi:hypothetical protein